MSNEYFFDHETTQEELESKKSSKVAFILACFFGGLGIHRFYTGYRLIGFLQLVSFGGFGLWAAIDTLAIATNRYEDSKGSLLRSYSKNFIITTIAIMIFISAISYQHLAKIAESNLGQFAQQLEQIDTPLDNIELAKENSHTHKILKAQADDLKAQSATAPSSQTAINLDGGDVIRTKLGLHILKSEPCVGAKNVQMICGEVVNATKEYQNNIVIKIHLFDKNKKFVAITQDKIYSIAPGETWNFKAPIYYGTVEGYKIVNITSD